MLTTDWNLESQHPIIQSFVSKLTRHPKRIVFSEGEDKRVIAVAAKLVELKIIAPILIGRRAVIEQMANEIGVSLKFVGIKDPETSAELELFCEYYSKSERFRGMKVAGVEDTVKRPQNFAAIMTQYGFADAMLGGNQAVPSTVFRSASSMIKSIDQDFSPFGVTILANQKPGKEGEITVLSDMAIIPNPTVQELAFIAKQTAIFTKHILGKKPVVAMVSHSSKGSNYNSDSHKVEAATELIQQAIINNSLDFDVVGEIQVDAALSEDAYNMKVEGAPFKKADALVFPDLDASNTALHLLEAFSDAKSVGHFIKGYTRPVAQVSRSANEASLLNTAIILGSEAIKYRLLYDADSY